MFVTTANAQPKKVWTREVNNPIAPGGGKDWATYMYEDFDGNFVAAGFTSASGANVVPALYKFDKNGNPLWSNPVTLSTCPGYTNYGTVGSIIQKYSGGIWGNYIIITKEKPCAGGVDGTSVYEIDKNTGQVLVSRLNIFS